MTIVNEILQRAQALGGSFDEAWWQTHDPTDSRITLGITNAQAAIPIIDLNKTPVPEYGWSLHRNGNYCIMRSMKNDTWRVLKGSSLLGPPTKAIEEARRILEQAIKQPVSLRGDFHYENNSRKPQPGHLLSQEVWA